MIRTWLENRKKRKGRSKRTGLSPSDRLVSVELRRGKILLEVTRRRDQMDKLIHERNHWKEYTR